MVITKDITNWSNILVFTQPELLLFVSEQNFTPFYLRLILVPVYLFDD